MIALLIIPLSSAYKGHQQDETLEFSFTDDLAISCNITSINLPNGSTESIVQTMTTSGGNFNGTIEGANFSLLGDYCINIVCQEGYGTVCRTVTYNGIVLNQERSILYGIFLAVLVLFFFVCIGLLAKLPNKNARDEEGKIISISWLKFVRVPLWGFIYLLFLSILFISSNLALAYLPTGFIGGFLFKLVMILGLIGALIPLIVFLYSLQIFLEDLGIKRKLERGVDAY